MSARLAATPAAFELAQAAWLAERLTGARPRFRGNLARAFPTGALQRLSLPPPGGAPAELVGAAFGLGGPFGPLPTPLSEAAAQAARAGAPAARDFLDLLNQRLFELLVAAARLRETHHQPGAPFESAAAVPLFAMLGLATAGLRREFAPPRRERLAVGADRMVLRFAGMLGRRVRHLASLEGLLAHALGVTVRAAPLTGAWVTLPPAARRPLGKARLGIDTALGRRAWDQGAGITLRLGPLPLGTLERFVPGGPGAHVLHSLADFHLGPRFASTVELAPESATVEGVRLGVASGARLGWTSWLAAPSGAPLAPARLMGAARLGARGRGDG